MSAHGSRLGAGWRVNQQAEEREEAGPEEKIEAQVGTREDMKRAIM